MNCPFCGRELLIGKLRSRGGNYFLPDGCKVPKLYTKASMEKAGAVMFPPSPLGSPIDSNWPTAYCCKACGKIILDC